MLEFTVLKKSSKSNARLGLLKTAHGEVETPSLVTVATQGVVKTLTSEEVEAVGSQLLICNTYHLHIRPGEKLVKANGGLHKFMNWKRPLMTDSGGFQVFSLGFGKDYGMGKILKQHSENTISLHDQPKSVKITEEGVKFRSYVDGRELFIGPKESMQIQEALGADIIFAFDEATSPIASYEYTKKSIEKTHRWAKICLEAKKSNQALFGIVQGGRFKDLRQESAKLINSLPFEGFGIGGEYGDDKKTMSDMLGWTLAELDPARPRHLLGIGYPEDIPEIVKAGVDTFDCIVPTHYARRGVVFSSEGKIDLRKALFLKDKKSLDTNCACFVCQSYTRSYIAHLYRANEITPLKLLTFHNLFYFNSLVTKVREDIKKGNL
jgi:queuine tRNA-ribosyltransferase